MFLPRSLLALLILSPVGMTAEIYPPKGDPIKGEVVSISDTELAFTQGDKKVTRPIKDVLKIDFRDVGKPASGTTYASVELTDGTQLMVSKYLIKKKEVEMTLLAGPTLKVPTGLVASILNNAHVEANRIDWRSRVLNLKGKEAVVIRRDDTISILVCVMGEGDEAGTSISFAVTIDGEVRTGKRPLEGLQGLVFKNTLDAKAPPVACKLLDTIQDVVMVSSVVSKDGGLSVTTQAGAKIDFRPEQVARLDYTKGKLEYLSDLEPSRVVAKSNLDEGDDPDQWHVYKDTNLDKKPLTVGGATYAKGLALKPYTELNYVLKGDYREFEAVVGIDDSISAAGATILVVEGDGKELANVTISSEDKKRSRPVVLNVKDVQRLRIIVKSDGDFDTSRHLDLADAKLRKE